VNTFRDKTSGARAAQGKKRSGRPPKVREASAEDYDQIAALQIRNGLATRPYDDWMALWRGNPVYEPHGGQWPIGWVLETESGEIVGSIGNVPLAYHFRGRELRAAAPCSWAVDARYRAYSMLILDRLLRQEDIDLFICSTVSAMTEPVFRVFQLSRVPLGTWDKSAFWVTNYRGFSQSALSRKSVPLAMVISYPVSAALFCLDRLKGAEMRVRRSTFEVELCREFDSRFDDFWEELKYQNGNVLLAVRTRETLAWHFRDTLSRQRAWILAASKGSRLVAYAIFDRQDYDAVGLKRVRLVDFQALSGSEEALRSALRWMLDKCREENVHILEVTGCWLDRPELPQLLAYHRSLTSWSYYYKANDKDLCETLKDPRVWAPSSFDGDASL
jgi:hypothetical protein